MKGMFTPILFILSLFCCLKTQIKLCKTIIFSQSYGCVTWFLTLGYFKTECWGKFWTSEGGNNRGWKKLHNEEHHYLYSSSGVTKTVKSRSMSLLEHVGWEREERCVRRFVIKPREHLEDKGEFGISYFVISWQVFSSLVLGINKQLLPAVPLGERN